jgi:hypothetical protein
MSVCVLSRQDMAEAIKPPRTLIAKFPYGAPLGPPDDTETQLGILHEALDLLDYATGPCAIELSKFQWRK